MKTIDTTLKSAVAAFFASVAASAHAGFTKSIVLDYNYDATQPLQDGTVYFVGPREVDDNRYTTTWFTSTYDERSGLAVAPGATVVIYVERGCKLDVEGGSGGTGGAGGAAGKSGTGGALFKSSTAHLNGSVANDNITTMDTAPEQVQYRIRFEENAEYGEMDVNLGGGLGNAPTPKRFGKEFLGWSPNEGGAGDRWFKPDGTPYSDDYGYDRIYNIAGDTTLYARWDDEYNFNPEAYKLESSGIARDGGNLVIPVDAATPKKFYQIEVGE